MTAPLTGRLLVATPALRDPNFARSVVLVLDNDAEGSLGVIVNRPTPVAVGDILPTWSAHATAPGVVFQGGPVARDSALGLVAVRVSEEPLGVRTLYDRMGLVDLDVPPEVVVPELSAIRIFAGYAGWGPGQLEGEVARGDWYVLPAEEGDAFTDDPALLWRQVLRRQGGTLALVSTFPEDPGLN